MRLVGLLLILGSLVGANCTHDPLLRSRAISAVFEESGILDWIVEHIKEILIALESDSDLDVYRCAVALTEVIASLEKGHYWAIKMVDSWGKIPTGILSGNTYATGDFDECLQIVGSGSNYTFVGRHCLVNLTFNIPANMTIQVNGKEELLTELVGSDSISFTFGQCYPTTCKPGVIASVYNKILSVANAHFTSEYDIQATIDSGDCYTAEKYPYSASEWAVLIIVILILFLASFCTTADVCHLRYKIRDREPHRGEQILLAFSVFHNGKSLLSLKHTEGTLEPLNGLKFLSICWVVLGHRFRYEAVEPLRNIISAQSSVFNSWSKMVIFSAPLSVDTFFFISGFLVMYGFCTARARRRRFNLLDLLKLYLHRYLRLTPPYAVMIALTATWLYRCGNGPYWNRITLPEVAKCQEYWWTNILYVNNYVLNQYCMLQSWYLSADMQLFWLSPIVVYPLWRWPWLGWIEVLIVTVISVLIPFLISYEYDIATPIPLSLNSTKVAIEMRYLYLPTHTKISGYILGIATGYLIYQITTKQIHFRISRWTSAILWFWALLLMLVAVFAGHYVYESDYVYNKVESALYIGFYKLMWSLGLSWIVIACITGYGGPINAILSWKILKPFARLTYCIYLTHIAVMFSDIGTVRQSVPYRDYTVVIAFLGELSLAIPVATGLSLLTEAPILALDKLIFGSRARVKAAASSVRNNDVEDIPTTSRSKTS